MKLGNLASLSQNILSRTMKTFAGMMRVGQIGRFICIVKYSEYSLIARRTKTEPTAPYLRRAKNIFEAMQPSFEQVLREQFVRAPPPPILIDGCSEIVRLCVAEI